MDASKSKHLKTTVIALSVVGLWTKFKPNTLHYQLYKTYAGLVLIYFVTFVITQYYDIYLVSTAETIDIFDLINNLSVSLLYTATIVKALISQGARSQGFITQIVDREVEIMTGRDEDLKQIYMRHVRWNTGVRRFMYSLTTVTIIPFFISPVLLEMISPQEDFFHTVDNATIVYRARPLPFSSWFPFDKYKYYPVSYGLHILSGSIGASITCWTDILFWSFMIYGVGQLKILQHYLRHFVRYADDLVELGKADIDNLTKEEAIRIVLRQCIVEHQTIIKFITELNKTLNILMLLDFMIASMQIGTIGFQVIVMGFGIPQLFALEYLTAMLLQMILFYWHANELLLESSKVSAAVWDSDWTACSISTKRALNLIMIRTRKPLTINVGPFYAMSTQTALMIVRAAYSYVALMRQMYVRKN